MKQVWKDALQCIPPTGTKLVCMQKQDLYQMGKLIKTSTKVVFNYYCNGWREDGQRHNGDSTIIFKTLYWLNKE